VSDGEPEYGGAKRGEHRKAAGADLGVFGKAEGVVGGVAVGEIVDLGDRADANNIGRKGLGGQDEGAFDFATQACEGATGVVILRQGIDAMTQRGGIGIVEINGRIHDTEWLGKRLAYQR